MFSRFNLAGTRTVLTGASSGIGRALAVDLAGRRARLVLASRDANRLDELVGQIRAAGGEAHAVPTDVADPAARARLVTEAVRLLGGLDVLVNNAGVGAMGFFADASEERLRRVFEINFFGATELTRLALPHLRHGGPAMIVNVSSVIGRRALPGCTEYCASKFALSGWSEGLRAELAPEGVHVLLVCPGVIATDFKKNLLEDRARFLWQGMRGMSAERCARDIVRGMRRQRNEVVVTSGGKLLLWLNRLLPRAVDYYLAHHSRPL
jgi:short-subunit dehydrogenase